MSRRNTKRKTKVTLFVSAVFVLFSAFIYLNELFFHIDGIPVWSDIYSFFGIGRSVGTAYNDINDGAVVHFIDVGQGDCTLIYCDGKYALIDCGEYEYSGRVIKYLNAVGVKTIDYMIISHPHSDHFGGMYRIAEKFDVENIIIPEIPEALIPVTTSFINLIDVSEEKGIPITPVSAGDIIEFSENGSFEIFAPIRYYEDLNNSSVVMRFNYGNTGFLFCGDIETEAEEDIISSGADITADVIKVAHHGSGTSSSKLFLQRVSARYAVFCVGEANDYGHPHSNIVSLHRKLGSEILRTDKDGNIIFRTDGENLSYKKQKAS